MAKNTFTAKGTYYWKKLFDYDLTGSKSSAQVVYKLTTSKTVDRKQFMSSKISDIKSYTYKQDANIGLSYEGLSLGSSASFEYHTQVSQELVDTKETQDSSSKTETVERTFNIPPDGKLAVYQLVYIMDGVSWETDLYSINTRDKEDITLKFQYQTKILGLDDILNQLLNTNPKRDNQVEWDKIRTSIVNSTAKSDEDRFRDLLETLKTIYPGRDNKDEWERIRNTCNDITRNLSSIKDGTYIDYQPHLMQLINRFASTFPGSSNTEEWAAIRKTCKDIKDNLKAT